MTNYTTVGDQYLESEILSAGPVRRIQLLYEGAIKAIAKARVALAEKDIPTRAAKVNIALDILSELALSLDHSRGASVTRELVELYDFAQRCLIEGSTSQVDKPFADAEQVLRTLLEAWRSVPEIEVPVATSVGHASIEYGSVDGFSSSISLSQVG